MRNEIYYDLFGRIIRTEEHPVNAPVATLTAGGAAAGATEDDRFRQTLWFQYDSLGRVLAQRRNRQTPVAAAPTEEDERRTRELMMVD